MLNVNVNVNQSTLKIIPPRLNHTFKFSFLSSNFILKEKWIDWFRKGSMQSLRIDACIWCISSPSPFPGVGGGGLCIGARVRGPRLGSREKKEEFTKPCVQVLHQRRQITIFPRSTREGVRKSKGRGWMGEEEGEGLIRDWWWHS